MGQSGRSSPTASKSNFIKLKTTFFLCWLIFTKQIIKHTTPFWGGNRSRLDEASSYVHPEISLWIPSTFHQSRPQTRLSPPEISEVQIGENWWRKCDNETNGDDENTIKYPWIAWLWVVLTSFFLTSVHRSNELAGLLEFVTQVLRRSNIKLWLNQLEGFRCWPNKHRNHNGQFLVTTLLATKWKIGWWFQSPWNIWVKIVFFPQFFWKVKTVWNLWLWLLIHYECVPKFMMLKKSTFGFFLTIDLFMSGGSRREGVHLYFWDGCFQK